MSSNRRYTIREYKHADEKVVAFFFEELQEHHIKLDADGLLRKPDGYGMAVLKKTLDEIDKKNGAFLVAALEETIVGFIAGTIEPRAGESIGTKPSRSGKVTELYVDQSARKQGVASLLMTEMEEYFIKQHCKYSRLDLFAPNSSAHSLYKKLGYADTTIELLKELV